MTEFHETDENSLEYLIEKVNMQKLHVFLDRFRHFRDVKEEEYLARERTYKLAVAEVMGNALRKIHDDPKESRENLIAVITGKNDGVSVAGGLNNLLSFQGFAQRDDFRVMLEAMDDTEYKEWFMDFFNESIDIVQRFSTFRSRVNQRYAELFTRNAFAESKKSKPNFQAGFAGVLLYCYDPNQYCLYKPTDYITFLNEVGYYDIPGSPGKRYKLFLDFAHLLVAKGKDQYNLNDLTDAHDLIYIYGYEELINPGPDGNGGSPDGSFKDFCQGKGFQFDETLLKNYVLSLKTKPFVILSGISGTGKTKIAQFFAQYMHGQDIGAHNNRTAFIPVRPDWMDNRGLLGYYNPVTEEYQVTELLKLLLEAKEDEKSPYFVILDEMNISKVEYYFSDFLSCLESRVISEDGKVIGESLVLHDEIHGTGEGNLSVEIHGRVYEIPPRLEIPENVYFTGTVNIDETTYFFSPKVLDRANVIEFNEIDLEHYRTTLTAREAKEQDFQVYADDTFINQFTDNGQYHRKLINKTFKMDPVEDDNPDPEETIPDSIQEKIPVIFNDILDECYGYLQDLNDLMRRYHLHFGYRVVDEVLFYLKNASDMGYFEAKEALDYQIVQKILTKLHGNRKKLEQPLRDLLLYFFSGELNEAADEQTKVADWQRCIDYYSLQSELPPERTPSFPAAANKVYRMTLSLKNHGYASFME